MNERTRLIHEFNNLFTDEANQRRTRSGISEATGDPVWVILEAAAMLKRVNEWRQFYDKKPLSKKDYERKERMCQGHSDYQHKLAIYCTELVMDAA